MLNDLFFFVSGLIVAVVFPSVFGFVADKIAQVKAKLGKRDPIE